MCAVCAGCVGCGVTRAGAYTGRALPTACVKECDEEQASHVAQKRHPEVGKKWVALWGGKGNGERKREICFFLGFCSIKPVNWEGHNDDTHTHTFFWGAGLFLRFLPVYSFALFLFFGTLAVIVETPASTVAIYFFVGRGKQSSVPNSAAGGGVTFSANPQCSRAILLFLRDKRHHAKNTGNFQCQRSTGEKK